MIGSVKIRAMTFGVKLERAIIFRVPEGAFNALNVFFAVIAPNNGLIFGKKVCLRGHRFCHFLWLLQGIDYQDFFNLKVFVCVNSAAMHALFIAVIEFNYP